MYAHRTSPTNLTALRKRCMTCLSSFFHTPYSTDVIDIERQLSGHPIIDEVKVALATQEGMLPEQSSF